MATTILLSSLFSLDGLGSVRYAQQTLTRYELTCGFADAIGLMLNAHESKFEVADKLRLVRSQTLALLL